jgi:hypothetical protein
MGHVDMKKSPFVPFRRLMIVDVRRRRLHERKEHGHTGEAGCKRPQQPL